MIVGESLWGVINAGVIRLTDNPAPFQLAPVDFAWINWVATGLFILLIAVLYGWIMARARAHKPAHLGAAADRVVHREHVLRLLEMRLVEHLAVERGDTGA